MPYFKQILQRIWGGGSALQERGHFRPWTNGDLSPDAREHARVSKKSGVDDKQPPGCRNHPLGAGSKGNPELGTRPHLWVHLRVGTNAGLCS